MSVDMVVGNNLHHTSASVQTRTVGLTMSRTCAVFASSILWIAGPPSMWPWRPLLKPVYKIYVLQAYHKY